MHTDNKAPTICPTMIGACIYASDRMTSIPNGLRLLYITAAHSQHDTGSDECGADPEPCRYRLAKKQPAEEGSNDRLKEKKQPAQRRIHEQETLIPEAEAHRCRNDAHIKH